MRTYRVAILGTTDAVGQEMIEILVGRNFPTRELYLLTSTGSVGRKLIIVGKEHVVEETTENSSDGMDIVLGAVEDGIAKKYLPIVTEKGAVVVDSSSAFRLDEQIPLIIPKVNPQTVREHHSIITNPNCATIITLVALQLLHAYTNIKRMAVSAYQAVSGTGVNGVHELNQQVGALAHGKEIAVSTSQYQIVYNPIPQTSGFSEAGYPSEEMKMQSEGRKIMSSPELCVDCTCVRVPVIRSHFGSTMVGLEKGTSVEKTGELLQGAPGIRLVNELQKQVYPMPLDTTDQDLAFVGRIREDMSGYANALSFWCCGDRIRRRATTNTVQIAELVIQEREKQQE